MFKGHDPSRGEYVNNPAWWCGGSRNLMELCDVEARFAENATKRPDWDGTDVFWEAAHGKPFFRRGRSSPLFNTSQDVAKAVHPGFSYNFPGMTTSTHRMPGWRTERPVRCSTFDGVEKPLVTQLPDDSKDPSVCGESEGRAPSVYSVAPSRKSRGSQRELLRRARSCPSVSDASSFTADSCSVADSVDSLANSVARSKYHVRPYHFGSLPGSKWPQHGLRLALREGLA